MLIVESLSSEMVSGKADGGEVERRLILEPRKTAHIFVYHVSG